MDIPDILSQSPRLQALAQRLATEGPPEAWLAAGCVVQTVWNHLTKRPLEQGILDYDIVYFDPDTRPEAEAVWQTRLRTWQTAPGLAGIKLDIKNQARVHQWYGRKFGPEIAPFISVAAAMSTWPTTATATAARLQQGRWHILAPFGTQDLLNLVVRPNRTLASRQVYEAKAARWLSLWPELEVLPWEAAIGPFEINGPVDLNPAQV